MRRKVLCSMALVVFLSVPGLADVAQNQGFAIGLNSAINLLGGSITADDAKFLAVDLQQVATEGPSLSGIAGNAAFGQNTLLCTTSTSLFASGGSTLLSGHQIPSTMIAPLNVGQISLPGNMPLLFGN